MAQLWSASATVTSKKTTGKLILVFQIMTLPKSINTCFKDNARNPLWYDISKILAQRKAIGIVLHGTT